MFHVVRTSRRYVHTGLTVQQFDRLMQPLQIPPHENSAVALSGGSDSMALCLLAWEWSQLPHRQNKLLTITVDHSLRANSADEADTVTAWMRKRGIPYQKITMRWPEKPNGKHLQVLARQKRFQILTDECVATQTKWLLLAHHLQDQTETLLMRMFRGSGFMGLGCIPVVRKVQESGINIVRPLLTVSKEQLEATCAAYNQPFVKDPSNHDPIFDRVRARTALASITSPANPHQIPLEHFHLVYRHALAVRTELVRRVEQFFKDSTVTIGPFGMMYMRLQDFLDVGEFEIQVEILMRALSKVRGQHDVPGLDATSRCVRQLRTRPPHLTQPLFECAVTVNHQLFVDSELSKAAGTHMSLRQGSAASRSASSSSPSSSTAAGASSPSSSSSSSPVLADSLIIIYRLPPAALFDNGRLQEEIFLPPRQQSVSIVWDKRVRYTLRRVPSSDPALTDEGHYFHVGSMQPEDVRGFRRHVVGRTQWPPSWVSLLHTPVLLNANGDLMQLLWFPLRTPGVVGYAQLVNEEDTSVYETTVMQQSA